MQYKFEFCCAEWHLSGSGSGDLSCQEKSEIVRVHNELRASVARGDQDGQPKAANMMEMVRLM